MKQQINLFKVYDYKIMNILLNNFSKCTKLNFMNFKVSNLYYITSLYTKTNYGL